MIPLLPEEEEYEAAKAKGGMAPAPSSLEDEMRTLMAIAFGVAILVGVLMVVLVLAYTLTGIRFLLILNLMIAVLAIMAFVYLMYRRSKLLIGY